MLTTQDATETIAARTVDGHEYAIEWCPWRGWDEYRVTRDGEIYADRLRLNEAEAVVDAASTP